MTSAIQTLLAQRKEGIPAHLVVSRPLIVVPGSYTLTQTGQWPLYGSDAAVMNVLKQSGGWPISLACLPCFKSDPLDVFSDEAIFEEAFKVIWSMLTQMDIHGLCVTGGGDLLSCLYGQTPHPQTTPSDLWRDIWERYLLLIARILRLPTFGICRGMQQMNVVRGGGLMQDLRSQWSERTMPALLRHQPRGRLIPDNFCKHPVRLHPQSHLAKLVQGDPFTATLTIDEVLSMHHQAVGYVMPNSRIVGSLAPKQRVAAIAFDGVIEALEDVDPQIFWLGVQFHPEWDDHLAWAQNLFHGFVEACRAYIPLTHEQLEELRPTIQTWVRSHDLPFLQKALPSKGAIPEIAPSSKIEASEIAFPERGYIKRVPVKIDPYKHTRKYGSAQKRILVRTREV
jgi:gamma-glutamyl-gamma-aminobutyrate hydrolase PuuD